MFRSTCVLKPEGLTFAPHPVVTDTDRDKYCVNRIVQFYQRQPTDLADYFVAAWRYKNRAALGMPDATLADIAAEIESQSEVSAEGLGGDWPKRRKKLVRSAKLQAKWQGLPEPKRKEQPERRASRLQEMRDWVLELREKMQPKIANLNLKGVGPGSQPFVLWKDRAICRRSG